MKRLLSHPSAPGLVVAVIAVVLALGGTALATSGGDGSAAKPHKGARPVTVKRLHAYVRRYVRRHPGREGARGRTGAQGPRGLQGATGLQGAPGPNGSGQVEQVVSDARHIRAVDTGIVEADCPAGEVATGGGAILGDAGSSGEVDAPDPEVVLVAQGSSGDGYLVIAQNTGNGTLGNANAAVQAQAVCSPGVDVTPATDPTLARALERGLAR